MPSYECTECGHVIAAVLNPALDEDVDDEYVDKPCPGCDGTLEKL